MKPYSPKISKPYWIKDTTSLLGVRYLRMENGLHSGQTIFINSRNDGAKKIEFVDTTRIYQKAFLLNFQAMKLSVSIPDGDENLGTSFCAHINNSESLRTFLRAIRGIISIKEIKKEILNAFTFELPCMNTTPLAQMSVFSSRPHDSSYQGDSSSDEDDPYAPYP